MLLDQIVYGGHRGRWGRELGNQNGRMDGFMDARMMNIVRDVHVVLKKKWERSGGSLTLDYMKRQ